MVVNKPGLLHGRWHCSDSRCVLFLFPTSCQDVSPVSSSSLLDHWLSGGRRFSLSSSLSSSYICVNPVLPLLCGLSSSQPPCLSGCHVAKVLPIWHPPGSIHLDNIIQVRSQLCDLLNMWALCFDGGWAEELLHFAPPYCPRKSVVTVNVKLVFKSIIHVMGWEFNSGHASWGCFWATWVKYRDLIQSLWQQRPPFSQSFVRYGPLESLRY